MDLKKKRRIFFLILGLFLCLPRAVVAINACTLNDPDKDIKRLFPESTGYTVTFLTIQEKGGKALKEEMERELGDIFEPVYEGIDAPNAFYTVFNGSKVIGYVHGVNQKGKYGGLQLMIVTGLDGKIQTFWYHRISSPEAARFQDLKFTERFNGLTLADFKRGGLLITDPSQNSVYDFQATLRGLKKNLIFREKVFLADGNPVLATNKTKGNLT